MSRFFFFEPRFPGIGPIGSENSHGKVFLQEGVVSFRAGEEDHHFSAPEDKHGDHQGVDRVSPPRRAFPFLEEAKHTHDVPDEEDEKDDVPPPLLLSRSRGEGEESSSPPPTRPYPRGS